MELKFTGEFAELEKFERQLNKADEVLGAVNGQMAEEAVELVRTGFEESRDPYGEAWTPLLLRNGRPLEDTGGLKASWHVERADRDGFSIGSSKQTAFWHQKGTGIYGPRGQAIRPKTKRALRLPGPLFRRSVKGTRPRKMVPDDGNVPSRWMDRFRDTAFDVLTEHFKRGRKKR